MEDDLTYVRKQLDLAVNSPKGLKGVSEGSTVTYRTIYNVRKLETAPSAPTIQRLATYFRKEAKKRERRALKEAK